MNIISFSSGKTAQIPSAHAKKLEQKLGPVVDYLKKISVEGTFDDPASSINLPKDQATLTFVGEVARKKMAKKPACMIVVGIGGSNLGTQAIYDALFGKQGNSHFPLYFADTTDSDTIFYLLSLLKDLLGDDKHFLLTLISKSGTTTESIANFECFLELLKKHFPVHFAEYVTIITDKDSKLWHVAQKEQFACLEIPAQVGGRYSVFSSLGLFPLLCTGVNVELLRKSAQEMVAWCCNADLADNPAARSAMTLAYYSQQGYVIHDTFLFDPALESLGKWYRQLMAESLGKKNKANQANGMTPTVSIGSTDLHSMAQLYLDGPANRITTFIKVAQSDHTVRVPRYNHFDTLVSGIQGASLQSIMEAIFLGVQRAYEKQELPFMTLTLAQKDAFSIAQCMQLKMCEIIYLGYLQQVNPFDQNAVELYKRETRKILAHE